MSVHVRDLLDLPAHVSRGDFVQSLADSLRDPERTVATYAVTPDLAENFREALKTVVAALANERSQPVFLHGSFGSGKSHFMAMLHLMLQGRPEPWRKPELHAVRETWEPLQGKRLLQLHFHMLGARSVEAEIFGRYVEHVRAHHPDHPLPRLFRDQEVFDNARKLREAMGDASFLAALNQGKAAVAGFGSLGGAETWTAPRFEQAVASAEPADRRALLTDLTRTLLPAFATQTDRFVDIDEGLAELSRHAAGLGYHGVVLYLDELILWLASQSADLAFVQREINKLVKLKEAQDEARDIPIVAFIARQRDLSELVGDAGSTGSERALIEETFAHHKSRFDTIDLSDSNLRAIIPHRVVVARTPDDRHRLEDGFEEMWRKARAALDTLQAGTADRDDFRRVYPFSPALVDVLVALSDRLQRDRTAIRILVEMLVEHLPDLELGEVVPVGDVFDLVASADDAVDGPSKAAFQRARDLYLHEVLPLLQARHGVNDPARCQRLRPGHPVRIGCSGCPVATCRNDNRLVKTLLLAALVPKARPFDGLTVKRLVHLNHGAVKAPVETMAIHLAATRLRDLAREVHPIRIGDDADPAVSVSLQSIDLKPILQRADDQDTRQRRRYVLRKLLWDQLGLGVHDNVVSHTVEFRHTRRAGQVRFGNVRTMRLEELRCPDGAEWHVVIDYPFDEEGYTPHDDERRVDQIRGQLQEVTSTLVWLPTFFSKQLEDDLGDLARLDHILDPANLRGFLSHLPPDEHQRARVDLESLRDRKRAEIREGLKKAYGLARTVDNDPHVDRNRDVQDHVLTLDDRVDARTPRGAGLAEGLEDLALQLLHARYPDHPGFFAPPSPARLNHVREFLERLLDEPSGMLHASRAERDDLQKIAEPLYLCRVFDQQVERLDHRYDAIEALREQAHEENPTLRQVRGWLDPEGRLGLPEPAANLVAWLWAHKHRRVALEGRTPAVWPSNGRLSEHVVFEKPPLPGEEVWGRALDRAALLGVTQRGKALNARNAASLADALRKLAGTPKVRANLALPARLDQRLREYAPGVAAPRLATARAVVGLLAPLDAPTDGALLEQLAAADLSGTSAQAIARSLAAAVDVGRALDDASWTVLALLRGRVDDPRVGARAASLLDRVGALLVEDELNAPFEPGLRALVAEAQQLLTSIEPSPPPPAPPRPEAPPGWTVAWTHRREVSGAEALAALDALRSALAERLDGAGDARVYVDVRLETRESSS